MMINTQNTVCGILALVLLASPAAARKRDNGAWSVDTKYEQRNFSTVVDFVNPGANLVLGQPTTLRNFQAGRLTRFVATQRNFRKINKRITLETELPYVEMHAEGGQRAPGGAESRLDSTISGFQSLVLRPTIKIGRLDDPKKSYTLSTTIRVQNDRATMDRTEQLVTGLLLEGGIGFASPLFSRGTDFTLDNVWNRRWGKKRDADFRLGYTFTGDYKATSDIGTRIDPGDVISGSVAYRVRPNPKARIQYLLSASAFTNAQARNVRFDSDPINAARSTGLEPLTVIPGTSPDIRRRPLFTVGYTLDRILNPKLANRLNVSYTFNGLQDYFTTSGGILRDLKIGSQYTVDYEWRKRLNRRDTLNYGMHMARLDSGQLGRIDIFNSSRFQSSVNLGGDRALPNGHSYYGNVIAGIGEDTPEVVASLGTRFSW